MVVLRRLVAHHGIRHCAQPHCAQPHCAQPNLTRQMRYMFKLRLNPTVRQCRLWNTRDIDDPEVVKNLNANHGWYGNEVRIEYVNRIKFWRFLTGDDGFDMSYWLSRLENTPEEPMAVAH